MFDTSKPNCIIMSDMTDNLTMPKTVGPYKVARALRDAGYQVQVVHHLSIFTIQEIVTLLKTLVNKNTLFVGFNNFFYLSLDDLQVTDNGGVQFSYNKPGGDGAMLPHGKQFNQLVKQTIQEINPDCKTVLGGPNGSDGAHNSDFDYITLGYADSSIVNLADHLSKHIPLEPSYQSIHGPTVLTDREAKGYNFVGTPMLYEDDDMILPGETLVTEISRGCIFKCAFCSYPLNGKKKLDFIKHKEILIQEFLDNYRRFGTTRYIFSDDTVNDSLEKCKMLAEINQALPFDLEWWGYIRLDLVAAKPDMLEYLIDSGLKVAFCGIETFNEATGAIIGKGGSRDRLIKAIREIKRRRGNRVCITGSFIHGLPSESLDSINQTNQFLLSDDNPLDTWLVSPLRIRMDTVNKASHGFLSDIDINYEKYGYKKILVNSDRWQNISLWENEHTNFIEMQENVDQLYREGKEFNRVKVAGNYAIHAMGMGYPEEKIFNQLQGDVDWHELDKLKASRAQQYRNLVNQQLGCNFQDIEKDFGTFTEFLKHQHKTIDKVKLLV